MKKEAIDVWQSLQDNWHIVTSAVVGVATLGKTSLTASNAKKSATKAHERIDKTRDDITVIRESMARIETNNTHIMSGIDELKQEMRRNAG